ncbi:MAG: Fic/DOC family N-terminal domain-containing protein [Bacilli bacterium]|nr:Fic/DOC family N-terminal domain-containing protein [Bacilli bacterium]
MNKLPFTINLNTIRVLKALNAANNKIGELKGTIKMIPNPDLVLRLIILSESKDSSAIENILTTYDEIYKELVLKTPKGGKPKEIINYNSALQAGIKLINDKKFLSTNEIVKIHSLVEPDKKGIRKLPGTVIINERTKEVVHTPPQKESEIRDLLHNLELYINNNDDYDPLIQMALIHFQFESIHPFYDGNGRTGRIINIIYLVLKEKLDKPLLYLSKYIIENKNKYYELLNNSQKNVSNLENFVIYMLRGIEQMAVYTIRLIDDINKAIILTKTLMQERLPDIYKHEIVTHLFSYMYTKNEFFREDLRISRATATKYLKLLESKGFITSERVGKEVIYKNVQLFNLVDE